MTHIFQVTLFNSGKIFLLHLSSLGFPLLLRLPSLLLHFAAFDFFLFLCLPALLLHLLSLGFPLLLRLLIFSKLANGFLET